MPHAAGSRAGAAVMAAQAARHMRENMRGFAVYSALL